MSRVVLLMMVLVLTSGVAAAESGGSGGASAFDEPEPTPRASSPSSSFDERPSRADLADDATPPRSTGGGMTSEERARWIRIGLIVGGIVVALIAINLVSGWLKKRVPQRVLRIRVGWDRPGESPWQPFEAIARSLAEAGRGGNADAKRRALAKVLGYAAELVARKRATHAATCEEVVPKVQLEKRFKDLARLERLGFDREVMRVADDGSRHNVREAAQRDPLLDEDGDFGVTEGFVVTLLVAVNRKEPTLPETVATPDDLKLALLALADLPAHSLRAVELVWSPAAQSDIMTRDDMERRYPDLAPLMV